MSLHQPLHFRPVEKGDDLEALTTLIRSAYAPHTVSGLRYWATHQSVEDTAQRLAAGHGFVATREGRVVATITLREPEPDSKVPLLREPGTWSFGQFAVAPELKGKGFGRQIHDFAVAFAQAQGCRRMVLHTAQPATALIAMYRSWGYTEAGTCDWRPHTNYLSVLMEKALGSPSVRQMAATSVADATVEIVPYDPTWPLKFEAERDLLAAALRPWLTGAIEHIGSTAVPGLAAKPVIDIMAPVHSLESSRAAIDAATACGYVYYPYKADLMHWFCRPSPGYRTHHLHLVPHTSPLLKHRLVFRDALRSDPALAAEYVQLKLRLAQQFRTDREAYTEGKSAFIESVLSAASTQGHTAT